MKIILYTKLIRRISGLQTFETNFIKQFGKFHEIIYLYDGSDIDLKNSILNEHCEIIADKGEEFECDICIYSSLDHRKANIKAKKTIQMYHADVLEFGYDIKAKETAKFTDINIAVGKGAENSLRLLDINCIQIDNLLSEAKLEKVLRLCTVSRIAPKKGFDRIIKLAKLLKDNNKLFIWEIYGQGELTYLLDLKSQLIRSGIDEVVFLGTKDNIQSYICNSDFLVQLSDSEGYCYSIHEALQIGVPCIVTNWIGVEKTITPNNGIILNMDLSNINIDELYNFNKSEVVLPLSESVSKWEKILKLS